MDEYQGKCFCGAVEIAVSGAPAAIGYCHCDSCKTWAAAAINGFSLWDPASVKVVKGADQIGMFKKTENNQCQF